MTTYNYEICADGVLYQGTVNETCMCHALAAVRNKRDKKGAAFARSYNIHNVDGRIGDSDNVFMYRRGERPITMAVWREDTKLPQIRVKV
jgi:TfoX/Sxy family transcriptional regulator of competence genes